MSKLSLTIKVVLLFSLFVNVGIGTAKADTRQQVRSLERQLELLQAAFAPETYREAVEKWATGVKTRKV